MSGYLRNQRRKGYPRQRRALRDGMRRVAGQFRVLAGAADDAAGKLRDITAAFSSVEWTEAVDRLPVQGRS